MFFRLIRLSVLLVGVEREENLIRNNPDKSEFTTGKKLVSEHQTKTGNGTYSRYGFIVGEFPSLGLTAGRTDRPSVRLCIVSGRVGEEERLSSGVKARIKPFLT